MAQEQRTCARKSPDITVHDTIHEAYLHAQDEKHSIIY
jgi:hypothetical protein